MIICCPFMSESWPSLSMRCGLSVLKSIFEQSSTGCILRSNMVNEKKLRGK